MLIRLHLSFWLLSLLFVLPGRAALAQVTVPSQGGEVNIIQATATTMTLTFGNWGTGQGRTVTVAAMSSAPPPQAAIDGTFYSASSTYGLGSKLGQGYVVYNGLDHTVIVTGLKPNTRYYITNAEYNTDGIDIAYNNHGTSIATATRNAAPLPVELTAFTGTVDAYNMATLHWTTATEYNTSYFAIERSTDGLTFAETGRVAASGTSSHALAYQWPDPQRLKSLTYYRLRQVDLDGRIQYSPVVTLAPTTSLARLLEVYPNPSAGQSVQLLLQGYGGESLVLRLTDAVGRQVLIQALVPPAAEYLAPLPLPQGLAAGTYVLTLAGSSSPVQKRLIISE